MTARWLATALVAALMLAAPAVEAQPRLGDRPVLVVDQDAVLNNSAPGRSLLDREEREKAELLEESQALARTLEAEERALSEQRQTMSPEDFAPLAAAFDERVVRARRTQDEKAAALARRIEAQRRAFFDSLRAVMADIMQDYGASLVLERRMVVITDQALDITDDVIARLGETPAEPTEEPPETPSEP
ncbi:MAG: OmpH family outer membrane protein [Pseudomonadota bacterium]